MSGGLEDPESNTPHQGLARVMVTVTHPLHPLYGQQFEFVGLRKGTEPTLVVRLPTGKNTRLPIGYTDYVSAQTPHVDKNCEDGGGNLLAVNGLLQAVNLISSIDRRCQVKRSVSDKSNA
jgi:hypothetical protein